MNEIEKLISVHPLKNTFWGDWLNHNDLITAPSIISHPNKKHRCLDEEQLQRQKAIDKLSLYLIKHHVSEKELYHLLRTKKRELYGKYSFDQFLDSQDLLPFENDNTQKGNLTEIILSEYIQETSGLICFVYKLRYNSNSEQSMKGDDVILFNKENLREKVLVGESKYRTTPNGTAIEEILEGFSNSKSKIPISVSFVSRMLKRVNQTKLANELSRLQCELQNGEDIPLVLAGFILSNLDVHNEIITHDSLCDYVVNQTVIAQLNAFHKSFPTSLSSLIGKTFPSKTKLKEAIDKLIKNDSSLTSNTLSSIDKGVNGFADRISQSTNIDQSLINDLQVLGLPVCNWTSVLDKRANDKNINSVVKSQVGETILALDKGYWKTILKYSDKSSLENFVCLTLGLDTPEKFIEDVFTKAKEELTKIEDFNIDYKRTLVEYMADLLDLDEWDMESFKKRWIKSTTKG